MAHTSGKQYKKYPWSKLSDLCKLKSYVVFDVETTGLSTEKEEIIEIAIAKINDGVLVDQFSSLVNPGKHVSARITKLNGLTDADLVDAPPFKDIAQQVVDFIGNSVILAHNATFDLDFLCNALSKCGIDSHFVYIDTWQLAKKAYQGMKNYKLETLILELGIAEKQTHRAMDDVLCTLALFQRICDKYSNPLVAAIVACCEPITGYEISVLDAPLKGLRLSLIGSFTFSYSAAKKLISVAGGTVVSIDDSDMDYLIYGFLDPAETSSEQWQLFETIQTESKNTGKPKLINEVAFLKLCGVNFCWRESNDV